MTQTRKNVSKTERDPKSAETKRTESSVIPKSFTGIMLKYAYIGGLKSPKDSRYVVGKNFPNSSVPVLPNV